MSVHVDLSRELERIERGMTGFMRREAGYISQMATREIAQRTPIGRQLDPRTGADRGLSGRLRRGWKPIKPRQSGSTWTAGSYNDVSYTRFVEDDTKRHIIEARTGHFLRFWADAHPVLRKRVMHPGTRGHHMAELGLKETQRQYARVADQRMQAYLDGKANA